MKCINKLRTAFLLSLFQIMLMTSGCASTEKSAITTDSALALAVSIASVSILAAEVPAASVPSPSVPTVSIPAASVPAAAIPVGSSSTASQTNDSATNVAASYASPKPLNASSPTVTQTCSSMTGSTSLVSDDSRKKMHEIPKENTILNQNSDKDTSFPSSIVLKKLDKSSPITLTTIDECGNIMIEPKADVVDIFNLGSMPGFPGKTIIFGHNNFGGKNGLFNDLDKLNLDDIVYFTYDDGSKKELKVTDKFTYPYNAPPSDILDLSGPSRVMMISCYGQYDQGIKQSVSRICVVAEPLNNSAKQ